jgi:glycosyltransferase involved in cell wall biosynthesis
MRATRGFHPNIVISVSPSLLGCIAAIRFKKRGSKVLILVQDLIGAAIQQTQRRQILPLSEIVSKVESAIFKCADSLGIVSQNFTLRLAQYKVDSNKIFFTPNYSLHEKKGSKKQLNRTNFGWSDEDFILMYTGNFGLKQDLGNLILAAKLIENTNPDFQIKIIGDGVEKTNLQKLASKLSNVQFLGLISDELYLPMLELADWLIIHESPKLRDMSMPSKLNSYLSSGKPILAVCSDKSATYSQVSKNNLMHCEPGDPEKLAESLRVLPSLPKLPRYPIDNESLRLTRVEWIESSG